MAKVVYLDPIDHLSGKISRKHRTTYNYRQASGRKYTSVQGTTSEDYTTAQQTCMTKFKTAAQQTNAIMTDIEQLEPYRIAWRNAIKNGKSRYSTLRGYIFAQIYKGL